jgi:hypothetical protein
VITPAWCIISAMEACDSYRPWHDKASGKTFVRPDSGKCLRYYFYFMDAALGLVYLRVPTWSPFCLQFYCNGHSWLARQMAAEGIGYTMADNAFVRIDDWQRAQELADALSPDLLHRSDWDATLRVVTRMLGRGLVHGVWELQNAPWQGHRGVPLWPWLRMTGWRAVHAVMATAELYGVAASPKGLLRHGFGVAAVTAGVPLNLGLPHDLFETAR